MGFEDLAAVAAMLGRFYNDPRLGVVDLEGEIRSDFSNCMPDEAMRVLNDDPALQRMWIERFLRDARAILGSNAN
jgi:hypothetical protein